MNKRYEKTQKDHIQMLVHACFIAIFLFGVYGCIVSPKLNLFSVKAEEYKQDWTYKKADGTVETFSLPANLDAEEGERVEFSTVLPDDIVDNTYLCMLSGRSFRAYIDGVEICSLDCSDRKIPGDVVKPFYVPITLKPSYAGKELTIIRDDKDCYNGKVNIAYIGSRLGIMRKIISGQGAQFIGAFILILISLIIIAVFTVISYRTGRRAPLVYLAEGILAMSVWIIFDSFVFQLVFGKYYVDGVIAYMMALLLATPFFMYIDSIQDYRYTFIYKMLEMVSVFNFVGVSICHFTDIVSYEQSLNYIDFFLALYAVIIIGVTISDYYLSKNKTHSLVMVGLLGMAVMSIFELLVIFIKTKTNANVELDGIFILIGLFVLLLFAVLDQVSVLNKLQKATSEAIAATKAKSDFLANMSHEIRTPINAIMGMNEMILRESNQDEIKEYAQDAKIASENLLEIVNDILDFSKIESGMMEIILDKYNLGEVISEVATLVNMKAENKGLKLIINVDRNLPTTLKGDDKRIREIITNILNNAVKYTEKGSIELNVKGEKIAEGKDANGSDRINLIVAVKDTGKGIREEDIDKIFGGFERVDMIKNKNIEGTGLGLSITKKLVEMMNGTITVESVYGEGSTFTVVLPQDVIDATCMGDYRTHRFATKEVETNATRQITAPDASILVVDDSAINLKVITKLLKKTMINVECVAGGQEALEAMQRQKYDIILLDHMMPNMDGIETLKASKELTDNKNTDTPIIALTANAIVGAKEMYMEAGFSDYLSKPIVPKLLEKLLLEYIPSEKIIKG